MKDIGFLQYVLHFFEVIIGAFLGFIISQKKAKADVFEKLQKIYDDFIKHKKQELDELGEKYEKLKYEVEELRKIVEEQKRIIEELQRDLIQERNAHNKLKKEFEKHKKL